MRMENREKIIDSAVILIALAIPLLIYAAPHFGQKGLIGNWDLNLPFWLYLLQFALGLGIAINLAKDFRDWIKPQAPSPKALIPVFAVVALALFVCISWIAPRHRVQSDESIFMATAQNMYANQIAGACNEGEFTESGNLNCHNSVHNFKTKGQSFIYALGITVLGNNLRWIFSLHLFLLLATIFLLYFAVRAWTANDNLAFLTAAIFAAQPTTLFQFRSASVEPLYTFMFALSVFLWKWAWDRNTVKHWILFALVLAFFAQTRQETVFCLGAFVVLSAFRMTNGKLFSILNSQFSIFILTLSFFSIPILLTISYYQGYGFQGGEFNAHGHFIENIKQAWKITVDSASPDKITGLLKNPFLSSFSILTLCGMLALMGFAYYEWKNKSAGKSKAKASKSASSSPQSSAPSPCILLFFLLYFPQIYVVFENVSGDLSIEINQRYTLIFFPIMAFFCAFAIDKASSFFQQKSRFVIALICAAALWGNTLSYNKSFKADSGTGIMYNRNHLTTEEVEILKWLKSEPKKNRLFVYSRPWHFIGYGMNAIHYNSLNLQNLQGFLQKYDGEVYYVRGLDCWDSRTYHEKAVEHRIPTVCDGFEQIFPMDAVFTTIITNNYRVVVAKLKEGAIQQPPSVELPENAEWLGAPLESRQDWGYLQIDISVTHKPLTIAKKRYGKGIGTHANGMLRYNLDSKYERLTAVLGLDEAEFCSNGVQIKVLGDGKLLADTGRLKHGEEYLLDISLSEVNQLIFAMDALGNIDCDHVDIAIPMLIRK
uniref:Glycosyl hydrolase family 98, putative carbohydrate binding module n=1 Tax=uncultured bacterium contig00028 TaxID=1181517 RepID=A0A806K0R0_9BACT|nr:glycosyl hydrolase family 98, putative carbohydrate binding module [uncultured bacterium contig00028]